MDYILSLVGKDQETITEAIKKLAKNRKKVKVQEKEIDWTGGFKRGNLLSEKEFGSKIGYDCGLGAWTWKEWG